MQGSLGLITPIALFFCIDNVSFSSSLRVPTQFGYVATEMFVIKVAFGTSPNIELDFVCMRVTCVIEFVPLCAQLFLIP